MDNSNISINSGISVTGSSMNCPSPLDTATPTSIAWKRLTPKSAPGVTRIKSSNYLHGSSGDRHRKKIMEGGESSAYITGRKNVTMTPQSPSVF